MEGKYLRVTHAPQHKLIGGSRRIDCVEERKGLVKNVETGCSDRDVECLRLDIDNDVLLGNALQTCA